MGMFGRVFGTDKAISDITDKEDGLLVRMGGWFDDLQFTTAERAKWGINQLKALEPFKVVQRIIALSTMFLWVFVALNIVAAIWIKAVWGVDAVTPLLKFAMSDYIFWPVLSVLSLYISGGVFPMIGKKKK